MRLIVWKIVNICFFKDFKLDIMICISWWNEDILRCSLVICCWSDLIWVLNLVLVFFKLVMLFCIYFLLVVLLFFKFFIMVVILFIFCLVFIKFLYMLCRCLLKCSKEWIWIFCSFVKFLVMVLVRILIFCLSFWKLEENINILDKKVNLDKLLFLWYYFYYIIWYNMIKVVL